MRFHRSFAIFLLAAATQFAPQQARAARGYGNCAHFIDTVPASISSQGVYCLREDLATTITSGSAIEIKTNNVTIDCNDFKIGGLAAGEASQAIGIHATSRQNVIVRNCNVRGYKTGIGLSGSGHLVEDNRLDNNLYTGIDVAGNNSLVRRNRVYDTGGLTGSTQSFGIRASSSVVDNTVDGVFTDATATSLAGIHSSGDGTQVTDNRVRAAKTGIKVTGASQSVSDNNVSWADGGGAYGIQGVSDTGTSCTENTVAGYGNPIILCKTNGGNNASL
jgi:parallel beta-helix repeat protein